LDQAKGIVSEGIQFDDYIKRFPSIDPVFLATALLSFGKEIQARYGREIDHIPLLDQLLAAVEKREIPKDAVFEILVAIAEGKISPQTIDFGKYQQLSDQDLLAVIRKIMQQHAGATTNAIMGKVMTDVRGRASGKRITELIDAERRATL
jgi:Glu-tRNA(Gln) amidotransferase subunit E-like FAD-binding protein